MKVRFLRGNTAENNGLTLPEGEISIDEETKAIRLHDGSTPGGFEIIGTRAYEPYSTLIAGDTTAGFYGEVPGTEFISYGDLSLAVGFSAGTLINDTESAWLKYSLDGQELWVAKKPCRQNLSWGHIYQAGCVYGVDGFGSNPSGGQVDQGTVVTISGVDYRVRLLKGAVADPTTYASGYDTTASYGSEWNRLLYPVHSGIHDNTNNPNPHTDPNADPFGSWATYSSSDLMLNASAYTWCQETPDTNGNNRLLRGLWGVTSVFADHTSYTYTATVWRPVLERI